jgi:hypothetical protein
LLAVEVDLDLAAGVGGHLQHGRQVLRRQLAAIPRDAAGEAARIERERRVPFGGVELQAGREVAQHRHERADRPLPHAGHAVE